MITKAIQLTLLCRDKEEAKAFYTEKLGFTVCAEEVFSPNWSYIALAPASSNETVIELVEAVTPEQKALIGKQAGDQVLIMFATDDIDQTYRDLKANGVVFYGEPQSVPGGRGVGFEDLYGNQLDLYEPDAPDAPNAISHPNALSAPDARSAFSSHNTHNTRHTLGSALLQEFVQEAELTRRVLERIPEEKLGWGPHPKSMTLGQLGLHIANVPVGLAELLVAPSHEIPDVPLDEASTVEQILLAHDRNSATVAARFDSWTDEELDATWTMTHNGDAILQLPRKDMVRSTLLNHWYHHRGQLTVYLRLLDIPLPAIYGPSADE